MFFYFFSEKKLEDNDGWTPPHADAFNGELSPQDMPGHQRNSRNQRCLSHYRFHTAAEEGHCTGLIFCVWNSGNTILCSRRLQMKKVSQSMNETTSCDFVEECIHCNGCIPGPVNNWAICHWKVSKYFILEIQSKNLFMFLIFEQHSYRTAVLLRMKQRRATTALLMDKNTAALLYSTIPRGEWDSRTLSQSSTTATESIIFFQSVATLRHWLVSSKT